jgi:hypothetical protein
MVFLFLTPSQGYPKIIFLTVPSIVFTSARHLHSEMEGKDNKHHSIWIFFSSKANNLFRNIVRMTIETRIYKQNLVAHSIPFSRPIKIKKLSLLHRKNDHLLQFYDPISRSRTFVRTLIIPDLSHTPHCPSTPFALCCILAQISD